MTIIFILLSLLIINITIKYINNNDDVNIVISLKGWSVLVGVVSTSTFLLAARYNNSIEFYYFYTLFIYLIITAYIDYKTTDIYDFLNYIMLGISILFIVMNYIIGNDIKPLIHSIIYVGIISLIMSFFRVWGGGDTEMFIAISGIIGVKGYVYLGFQPITMGLVNVFLATMVLSVISLVNILIGRYELSRRVAFAPYIAFSSIFIVLFL